MRDPGEVHKATLDEFKGAWMYKQAEPIADGVISSSNAICPSMGLRESQNSCRKKYSIGSLGDSLMTQLHCDSVVHVKNIELIFFWDN